MPGLASAQHPVQAHLAEHAALAQARTNAAGTAAATGFLDEHQLATLRQLAERIVPGAGKALTAEFLDQLLTVESQANQRAFLTALGIFEGRALELRRGPWVKLAAAEQDGILAEVSTMESGIRPAPTWTRDRRSKPGLRRRLPRGSRIATISICSRAGSPERTIRRRSACPNWAGGTTRSTPSSPTARTPMATAEAPAVEAGSPEVQ